MFLNWFKFLKINLCHIFGDLDIFPRLHEVLHLSLRFLRGLRLPQRETSPVASALCSETKGLKRLETKVTWLDNMVGI